MWDGVHTLTCQCFRYPYAYTLFLLLPFVQIAGKRWKIDLKSRQEAGLLLSAVNLPGGIQVRRGGGLSGELSDGLRSETPLGGVGQCVTAN